MKLEKSVELLKLEIADPHSQDDYDLEDAMTLGIEALELIGLRRLGTGEESNFRLPSEK